MKERGGRGGQCMEGGDGEGKGKKEGEGGDGLNIYYL